jgi:hypothetical protein
MLLDARIRDAALTVDASVAWNDFGTQRWQPATSGGKSADTQPAKVAKNSD